MQEYNEVGNYFLRKYNVILMLKKLTINKSSYNILNGTFRIILVFSTLCYGIFWYPTTKSYYNDYTITCHLNAASGSNYDHCLSYYWLEYNESRVVTSIALPVAVASLIILAINLFVLRPKIKA